MDSGLLRTQALRAEVLGYFEWDRWNEAIAVGEQLIAVAKISLLEHADQYQRAALALACAYAHTGRQREARALLQRLRGAPPAQEQLFLGVYQARLALVLGRYREAERLLLASLEVPSGRYALPLLLAELVELAARKGNRQLFERFEAQALEIGWRSGARKALAQSLRARGMFSLSRRRLDDAEADLSDALNRFRVLGTRWEEARTRVALASLAHRRRGDGGAARARVELETALDIFLSLDAVADVARVRAALAGGEIRFA